MTLSSHHGVYHFCIEKGRKKSAAALECRLLFNTAETVFRIIIAVIAVVVLVLLSSLMKPRQSVRARPVKRYTVRHYQNSLQTGTTYYVVMQLENGKKRKINVRTRRWFEELDRGDWGLLTMKGVVFVRFEYIPDFRR